MLNNAVEHSQWDRGVVRLRLEPTAVGFEVKDRGIGVFHSIASKLRLEDERAALVELLKGKTATMREKHSGEGIFFTSRVAARFVLRSHRIRMEWIRFRGDVFVSQERFVAGTLWSSSWSAALADGWKTCSPSSRPPSTTTASRRRAW